MSPGRIARDATATSPLRSRADWRHVWAEDMHERTRKLAERTALSVHLILSGDEYGRQDAQAPNRIARRIFTVVCAPSLSVHEVIIDNVRTVNDELSIGGFP